MYMFNLKRSTSLLFLWLTSVAFSVSTATLVSSDTVADDGTQPTNADKNNLIVDLGYAKYQGHINPSTGNSEFLGVRFARAPVGELRWQAPQIPLSVENENAAMIDDNRKGEVVQADKLPDKCIATTSPGIGDFSPFVTFESVVAVPRSRGMVVLPDVGVVGVRKRGTIEPPPMSEDCLFLNVYVPGALNATGKHPVVVWIHGGGYARGSAAGISNNDFFDGNDLVHESSALGVPVVSVVIQYRLALFGFLAGSEVKKKGALNAGLLDQQMALKWVREHISKFNGDPEHVVVWGQSAGSGSSIQHMLANGGNTQPRLLKTIMSSSSFFPSQYAYNDPIPEQLYSKVIEQAGCATTSDTLSCLRSTPVEVLTSINNNITVSGFYGTFAFTPVVDGTFVTKRITQMLKDGKFNGVDMVFANTNSFEGIHFVNPANPLPLPQYIKNLFPTLGEADVQKAARLYANLRRDPNGNETMTRTNQAVAVHGEAILICPTYYLLHAFDGRAFKSEFAIPPGDHITDVPYYWPSQGDGPAYKNPVFDTAFASAFLGFAISQNPTTHNNGVPAWNRWSARSGMMEMFFNKTEGGQPVIKPVETDKKLLERCKFWESVSDITGQ